MPGAPPALTAEAKAAGCWTCPACDEFNWRLDRCWNCNEPRQPRAEAVREEASAA